ncbi:MAG TPA: MarR family transcriptional regulator [Gammaproteobacteria bacterium]|nr:MarR family transcriptional regulator [Gammaproteobacteria bacterium]
MVDRNDDPAARERLNQALEALHFGFRAITAHPDQRLQALGYSRVHHRVLYFVGRNPGCSINELLGIMRVSKQYLHRPLRQLVEDGYVEAVRDPHDRRVKRLHLTRKGQRLEERLTGEQRAQLAAVFAEAGPRAEAGWRRVMALLGRQYGI